NAIDSCEYTIYSSRSSRAPMRSYALSRHDALPIFGVASRATGGVLAQREFHGARCALEDQFRWCSSPTQLDDLVLAADRVGGTVDRKSTRLHSSHVKNSYAVFCMKK